MLINHAIRRVIFLWLALLTVSACTTTPHEAVNPSWVEPNSTLQVLYIPSPEPVYVEVASGAKRYADYEISVGANLAAGILGGSAGVWAGASYVAAGSGASPLLFVNPYTAAASIVVAPVIGSAIEARRQAVARNKAKPFQALLAQTPVLAAFAPVLEEHLATNQSLGFGSHDLKVLDGAAFASKKNIKRQQGMQDGKILLVGSTANFSPKFETLEVTLRYALFQKSQQENESKPSVETLYENVVVVQSTNRTALDGSDRRDELDLLMSQMRSEKFQQINDRKRLSKYQRNVEKTNFESRLKRKRRTAERAYNGFDRTDPKGATWLKNEGHFLKVELAATYVEAARLLMADLAWKQGQHNSEPKIPAGASEPYANVTTLDTPERQVFRLENGPLLSLNRRSRIIHLSQSD